MPVGVPAQQFLNGLRAFDPKRLRDKVQSTAADNGKMLMRLFMGNGIKSYDSTDRWSYTIDLLDKEGVGSYQPVFGQDSISVPPPPVKPQGPLARRSYNIETYDLSIVANQKVTPEVIYNEKERALQSGLRGMANDIEPQLRRPATSMSDEQFFMGIEGWLPPSQTSGGSFTASADPSFGGVYTSLRDGTWTSSLYGVDRNNVANARLRGGTVTRTSTPFTYADAQTLFKACMRANFVPTAMVGDDGEVFDQSDIRLLFPQSQHDDMVFIQNQGPDDQQGQVFRFDGKQFAGHQVIRVPELDNDATASIYGLQMKTWCWFKKPGFWMNRSEPLTKDLSHNTRYVMTDMHGALVCLNPRANFRFHAAF